MKNPFKFSPLREDIKKMVKKISIVKKISMVKKISDVKNKNVNSNKVIKPDQKRNVKLLQKIPQKNRHFSTFPASHPVDLEQTALQKTLIKPKKMVKKNPYYKHFFGIAMTSMVLLNLFISSSAEAFFDPGLLAMLTTKGMNRTEKALDISDIVARDIMTTVIEWGIEYFMPGSGGILAQIPDKPFRIKHLRGSEYQKIAEKWIQDMKISEFKFEKFEKEAQKAKRIPDRPLQPILSQDVLYTHIKEQMNKDDHTKPASFDLFQEFLFPNIPLVANQYIDANSLYHFLVSKSEIFRFAEGVTNDYKKMIAQVAALGLTEEKQLQKMMDKIKPLQGTTVNFADEEEAETEENKGQAVRAIVSNYAAIADQVTKRNTLLLHIITMQQKKILLTGIISIGGIHSYQTFIKDQIERIGITRQNLIQHQ